MQETGAQRGSVTRREHTASRCQCPNSNPGCLIPLLLMSVRCAGIVLFILATRKLKHTDMYAPCPRSPSGWMWMRQKANPGLLSVGRTRLGYRRRHFPAASDSPAGFCLRTPASSEFGWVPASSDPRVNQLFLSIASSCSARGRQKGTRLPKSCRRPGSAVLAKDGAEVEAAGGIPGPTCRAELTISPSRPTEGAAARASGPKAPGPWTGMLDLQTSKLRNPKVGGIFSFVYLFGWLAPLWPLTSALGLLSPTTLPHLLSSGHPTSPPHHWPWRFP